MRSKRDSDVRCKRSYRSIGQGCWMQGRGENIDIGVGYNFTGRAEGLRVQCNPFIIRMEGIAKEQAELGKGSFVRGREVHFFRCYLRGSSLKDTVRRDIESETALV